MGALKIPHTEILVRTYLRKTRCETYVHFEATTLLELGILQQADYVSMVDVSPC